jgi:peptidoglycan/LPS O-acetylase OafA/YrhL
VTTLVKRAWPLRRELRARLGPDRGKAPVRERDYRGDLQGLRGVAVLLVALDHAGVGFLKGGYVGVDVFFVLSGFLITGLLLQGVARDGHVSFRNFYARRARRILPAAALTLATTTIVADLLLNYVRARQVAWDSFWASLFAANIRFAHEGTNYFAQGQPPSAIQHYWSLAVEEQFYLVWPALLAITLFGVVLSLGTRRQRSGRGRAITRGARLRVLAVIALLGTASLLWSIHYTDALPAAAYFSTRARAWELALGAALAVAAPAVDRMPHIVRVAGGWLGIAAIAIAATKFSAATPYPGYKALLPTVGAALVIAGGMAHRATGPIVGKVLAVQPLRYVGDRSYTFYLWHWPALTIAMLYVGHELGVGMNMVLLLGAFLLSIVTYALFENPIRRARWNLRASAVLVPVSVASVIVVTVVTLSSVDAKIARAERASAAVGRSDRSIFSTTQRLGSHPLRTVVLAVRAAKQGAKLPSPLTPPLADLEKEAYSFPPGCVPATADQTTSPICKLGDATASKTIVVFGDSHAQMWMPAVLPMAEHDGWTVIPLVKSGCVTSSWVGKGYPNTPPTTIGQCHAWFKWAKGEAKTLDPDVVLMSGCCAGATGTVLRATKAGYSSVAAALKGTAEAVILVADDDGISKQPVDCLLARHATMKSCTTTWTAQRFASNEALAKLAGSRGFGYLDTRGWFCDGFMCPFVVGHTVVYRDTGHITQAYGRKVAVPFRNAFRRCLFSNCPA